MWAFSGRIGKCSCWLAITGVVCSEQQQLEGLPEPRAGPHLQGSCIRRLDAAAV